MESLGSPKAMPNLDIKSKGLNYTITIGGVAGAAVGTVEYN